MRMSSSGKTPALEPETRVQLPLSAPVVRFAVSRTTFFPSYPRRGVCIVPAPGRTPPLLSTQASSKGKDSGLPSRGCGFNSRRLLHRAFCCCARHLFPPSARERRFGVVCCLFSRRGYSPCRYRLTAGRRLPKPRMRVRFSLSAPRVPSFARIFSLLSPRGGRHGRPAGIRNDIAGYSSGN